MKNVQVKSRLAIVALLFVLFCTAAMAQSKQRPLGDRQGPPRMEEGEHKKGPRIPDLTEEQAVQLKELRLANEKIALPIHNQIAEKEARLNSITSVNEINLEEAGRVIQEISDLKAQLMVLRVENLAKMKDVLTEEQALALNHQFMKKPEGPRGGKPGFERGR